MKERDLIGLTVDGWMFVERPGYFGRRRDQKHAEFDAEYGKGNWRLAWSFGYSAFQFLDACLHYYEASYTLYLRDHPELVDWICSYGECIDNAHSNVKSGTNYLLQEAFSTHIQDIAVRNALAALGRKFEGPPDRILVIRSKDSEGYKIGPGNIPFWRRDGIVSPSRCPDWASFGSVEDFWQSNKWLQTKEHHP